MDLNNIEIFTINGINTLVIANVVTETKKFIELQDLLSIQLNYNEDEKEVNIYFFPYVTPMVYPFNDSTIKLYKTAIKLRTTVSERLAIDYLTNLEELTMMFDLGETDGHE